VVTTAAGTPGERGPVVMAGVITTADPNTATSATLTTWFEAPRDAVTAPIGTGLTPVVGDTASFTWAAGAGQPQAAYSYNGSIWVPVSGQVISGNVIVRGTIAGNAMIANTITATQIAAGTITATQIAAGTITATQIAANTITAGQIAANTITGNNIAAGTITTNNFTANTIQGNIIAAGTITATQLAANAITANTVISSGAVLGSNASLGFWLDGPTGNARFGNSISIGNQLTVGSGANIGAGLIVGTGANIGTNLQVGNSAIIGNSVTIGTNLTVGANANIGGNLFVSGLITTGILNANTVSTTTILPSNVTVATSNNTTSGPIYNSPSNNVWYSTNITTTLTPPNPPTSMYVLVWDSAEFQIFYTGQAISITTEILRTSSGGNVSLDSTTSNFISSTSGSRTLASTYFTNGWIDATLPSGSPVMTYVRRIKFGTVSGYSAPVVSLLGFQNVSITTQIAKR
jgi:carbonic anhydrase/acetyltransferase-like protein (isoleucine patch superfamily)